MKTDKQVVVVVEPHADDTYLSCHQHVVDWIKDGKTVVIVTVFSGTRKRGRDAISYAAAVGAESVGLGYDEFAEESLRDAYLNTPFDPLVGHLGMIYSSDAVLVVGPLGIQNPDHKAVSEWLKGSSTQQGQFWDLAYYVEIPYYTKLKNEDEVNGLIRGRVVESVKKAKHYKADEKYWKCFKDQAKFFHFNPPESYKDTPEILVSTINK